MPAVEEINNKTDRHPNNEADPSICRQGIHLSKTDDSTKNGNDRYEWSFKRPFKIGTFPAQYDDAGANDNECKERTDGNKFS